MFKSQIIAGNEIMSISNFLASYCAADKEMQAFVAKVVKKKEKKNSESLISNCYMTLCRATRIC